MEFASHSGPAGSLGSRAAPRTSSLKAPRLSSQEYLQRMKHVFAVSGEATFIRPTLRVRQPVTTSAYPDCHLTRELAVQMQLIKAYQRLSEDKEPNQRVSRPRSRVLLTKRPDLGAFINQHAKLLSQLNREPKSQCSSCLRFSCACQSSLLRRSYSGESRHFVRRRTPARITAPPIASSMEVTTAQLLNRPGRQSPLR